jgi:hypothetical protein
MKRVYLRIPFPNSKAFYSKDNVFLKTLHQGKEKVLAFGAKSLAFVIKRERFGRFNTLYAISLGDDETYQVLKTS